MRLPKTLPRPSIAGGDHPAPIGVTNSPLLLPGGKPYRMAANNYYLGHFSAKSALVRRPIAKRLPCSTQDMLLHSQRLLKKRQMLPMRNMMMTEL